MVEDAALHHRPDDLQPHRRPRRLVCRWRLTRPALPGRRALQGARRYESYSTSHGRPFNSTSSSAGIRTSPSARPICGAIFDAARPADELAEDRAARRRRRISGRTRRRRRSSCSGAAASKTTSAPERSLQAARRRPRRPRRVGAGRAKPVADDLGARPRRSRQRSRRRRNQEDARRRARSQATRSSPSIPAPAAPSRRTGPRCCCACTCAGRSAAASSAR